ncbi:fas-associated death domain protein [Cochliomyia hominivorax]
MGQPINFDTLKCIVANDQTVQDNLENLKSLFRSDISSVRNMMRIRTVADLLDCLERHDSLSPYNIEPLREVADLCGGALEDLVASYYVPNTPELHNEYHELRISYEMESRLQLSGLVNGITNNGGVEANINQGNSTRREPVFAHVLSDDKNAAIQKLIASDIGTDWRCFGRELEVCQGDLDNIEINYRDLKTRVFKLFQVFEENDAIDPKKHLHIIMKALEECRRKDLCRKIQKILSH